MKALSGGGTEPLRHLDFLLFQPERSVILHGGGVPVVVPRAERFAVHKVIVPVERRDPVKSDKDAAQADTLIQLLAKKRHLELAEAWKVAWDTGDRSREKLEKGQIRLSGPAQHALEEGPHPMIRLLARVIGVGIEAADMLVHEILARILGDRRAVARYAGLTGAPDESGTRRREKGLARAGNARVRRGMIQLAWRFLMFQKGSALAQWYRTQTADARSARRKTMIVGFARKLLIALWRLVTIGEIPQGVTLRPAT